MIQDTFMNKDCTKISIAGVCGSIQSAQNNHNIRAEGFAPTQHQHNTLSQRTVSIVPLSWPNCPTLKGRKMTKPSCWHKGKNNHTCSDFSRLIIQTVGKQKVFARKNKINFKKKSRGMTEPITSAGREGGGSSKGLWVQQITIVSIPAHQRRCSTLLPY